MKKENNILEANSSGGLNYLLQKFKRGDIRFIKHKGRLYHIERLE